MQMKVQMNTKSRMDEVVVFGLYYQVIIKVIILYINMCTSIYKCIVMM